MADPRFFKVSGPFTLGQLAEMTGSVLSDPALASKKIVDVAPLQDADDTKLSFLDNKKYLPFFKSTKAAACFVRPELAEQAPQGVVCLTHKNPYKAYAIAAQAFYPAAPVKEFRAPSAVIAASAQIGKDTAIEHGVVIGENVKIGDRCRINPHAVICDGVEIGNDCDIGANTYITHALIGRNVRLHPGVCVGRPGFGFAIDPTGFVAVPQLGRVIIGDDVDIGANSTVDRGAGPDTIIGQGTRIDNLVQLGHNAQLGKYCIMVSQSGVSGSTQLGDYVMMGGQVGIAGHLKIGSGAKIAAQSGVMRDVDATAEVMGTPAVPIKQFMRQVTHLSRMSARKGEDKE